MTLWLEHHSVTTSTCIQRGWIIYECTNFGHGGTRSVQMRGVHISNRAEGYNFNKTSAKLIQTRRPVKAVFNFYPQGITHTNKELVGIWKRISFSEITFRKHSWLFAILTKFSVFICSWYVGRRPSWSPGDTYFILTQVLPVLLLLNFIFRLHLFLHTLEK